MQEMSERASVGQGGDVSETKEFLSKANYVDRQKFETDGFSVTNAIACGEIDDRKECRFIEGVDTDSRRTQFVMMNEGTHMKVEAGRGGLIDVVEEVPDMRVLVGF